MRRRFDSYPVSQAMSEAMPWATPPGSPLRRRRWWPRRPFLRPMPYPHIDDAPEYPIDRGSQSWPRVGKPGSTVAGLCDLDAESVTRVFLPFVLDGDPDTRGVDARRTWARMLTPLGIDVTADLTLRDEVAAGRIPEDGLDDAQGNWYWHEGGVEPHTWRMLSSAITDAGLTDQVNIIGWTVYAENVIWGNAGALTIPSRDGGVWWEDGNHVRIRGAALRDVDQFATYNATRFPVALIAADGSYLVSAPGYSDSLYVSGPMRLAESLRDHGLECAPVDVTSDALLPSSHD